jgi:hypothetical protein
MNAAREKRWRFTLRRVFLVITSLGVSIGLMRFAFDETNAEELFVGPVAFAGIFGFGGTIGAFAAHLCVGTDRARQIGFLCGGGLAFFTFCAVGAYFAA